VIKTVGTVQKVGFGIGITLSVLSLGLVGFSWVKYRRVVKEMREENMESTIDRNNKDTKIKISMQKVDAQKLTE
jgi:acylphosphatase